jgi:hypothetical protein
LQDGSIVEAHAAQSLVVFARDARGVLGQLHHVIEHRAIPSVERRRLVVLLQRADQLLI